MVCQHYILFKLCCELCINRLIVMFSSHAPVRWYCMITCKHIGWGCLNLFQSYSIYMYVLFVFTPRYVNKIRFSKRNSFLVDNDSLLYYKFIYLFDKIFLQLLAAVNWHCFCVIKLKWLNLENIDCLRYQYC